MLKKNLIVAVILLISSVGVGADTLSPPVQMIKSVTENTISEISTYKKQHANVAKLPFTALYSIVSAQLLPHVNIDRMLNSVLARQCTYLNSSDGSCKVIVVSSIDQQTWQALRQQFVNLLVNLYGTALSSSDQYEITFIQNRGNVMPALTEGATMQVSSQVQMPNTAPITLVYQLVYTKNQWLVYDLTINGSISIANNLRAQFAPTIQQKGIPGLLNLLTQHNTGSGS
jgi:ABC-type transporter MlaC component